MKAEREEVGKIEAKEARETKVQIEEEAGSEKAQTEE